MPQGYLRDSVDGVLAEMRDTLEHPPAGFTTHEWLDCLMHRCVRVLADWLEHEDDRQTVREILKLYAEHVCGVK